MEALLWKSCSSSRNTTPPSARRSWRGFDDLLRHGLHYLRQPDLPVGHAGMEYTAVLVATCVSAAIGCRADRLPVQRAVRAGAGHGPERVLYLHGLPGHGLHLAAGADHRSSCRACCSCWLRFLRSADRSSPPFPPRSKAAISAGIGLFIALIGLLNAGIVVAIGNLVDLGAITTGRAAAGAHRHGHHRHPHGLEGQGRAGPRHCRSPRVIGIPMGMTILPRRAHHRCPRASRCAPTFFKLDFGGLMDAWRSAADHRHRHLHHLRLLRHRGHPDRHRRQRGHAG